MEKTQKHKRKYKGFLIAILFLLPFMLPYTVFVIWPVIQGIYVSLHDWGLMGKLGFVGGENYVKMVQDPFFWEAIWNTTKFVIILVPIIIIVSLIAALLANRPTRLRKFARVSFYMPNVLSVSVISVIANFMFAPYMGLVNDLLQALRLIPANYEPQWFINENLAWVTIIITTVWWTLGSSMMLYLAGLQDIPEQLHEAAAIDGASPADRLFRITLPLLKPTTALILFLQVIGSFKVFGQIYQITGGGPGTKTRPIVMYIYSSGFVRNDLGYASAMSYALFVILLIFSIFQLRWQTRGENI